MRQASSNAARPAGSQADLVPLDPDHPGFRDVEYRARRNAIARVALEHESGTAVPEVAYTEAEQEVWREVWRHLDALHESRAARPLVRLCDTLGLSRDRIPQLGEVNDRLTSATGFRMEPVAGLVQPRVFLRRLGERVFLSTQYVRHPSRPLYTPEPDVVHELVGHAATLIHPRLAAINEALGCAAARADARRLGEIERVYWYTLEYGAVEESGRVKAFGAGLLSSFGELQRFESQAELREWDLAAMAATPYDPTDYQRFIFVAPSFERLLHDVEHWARADR